MKTQRAVFGMPALSLQHIVATLSAAASAGVSVVLVPGLDGALGAGLAVVTVTIAAIDSRHFTIPDGLSATAFGLGLLQAVLRGGDMWLTALAAALLRGAVVAAAFWLVRVAYRRLRGREGLGFGDVKLAGVAGVWLSWATVPIVVEIAALSAIVFYVLRQYGLGRRVRAHGRLPFGAFLAPAIWLGWGLQTIMLGRG